MGNAKNDPLSLQLENHNIIVQLEQPVKEIWSTQWRLGVESNLWSQSCLGGTLTDLYVHAAMPIHMYRHYPRVPLCAHPGFWKTRLLFPSWVLKGHLTKMQCHSALQWHNIFRIIISWWQDSCFKNHNMFLR